MAAIEPSPALVARCLQLASASATLRKHILGACNTAYHEGFAFPDLLDDCLRELERQHDRLAFLLNPNRLVNFANDHVRRNDPEASAATQASTEDGRAANV